MTTLVDKKKSILIVTFANFELVAVQVNKRGTLVQNNSVKSELNNESGVTARLRVPGSRKSAGEQSYWCDNE